MWMHAYERTFIYIYLINNIYKCTFSACLIHFAFETDKVWQWVGKKAHFFSILDTVLGQPSWPAATLHLSQNTLWASMHMQICLENYGREKML